MALLANLLALTLPTGMSPASGNGEEQVADGYICSAHASSQPDSGAPQHNNHCDCPLCCCGNGPRLLAAETPLPIAAPQAVALAVYHAPESREQTPPLNKAGRARAPPSRSQA